MMDDEATIYSVDVYQPAIEDMKKDVEAEGITNIIPIQSNVSENVALDADTVDVCLMINVFHHFVGTKKTDKAINEFKRITNPRPWPYPL